eukprot:c2021_g1_i2 orf=28-423(+)
MNSRNCNTRPPSAAKEKWGRAQEGERIGSCRGCSSTNKRIKMQQMKKLTWNPLHKVLRMKQRNEQQQLQISDLHLQQNTEIGKSPGRRRWRNRQLQQMQMQQHKQEDQEAAADEKVDLESSSQGTENETKE